MTIWVDADACPVVIKEILYRAAGRVNVPLVLVANRPMRVPNLQWVSFLLVGAGFDVADHEIVKRLAPGDLLISSDIPLAWEVIEKGGHVLSPRGEFYTPENIKARLNIRDFMDTLRASGIETGGPPPMRATDRKAFADQLDAWLANHRCT